MMLIFAYSTVEMQTHLNTTKKLPLLTEFKFIIFLAFLLFFYLFFLQAVREEQRKLVWIIEQLLDWEVADLIKKVDIIRLDGA